MDNDEVRQLLVRIGRQDEAAFRQLYKAFSRKVYAYVLNMLNDHSAFEAHLRALGFIVHRLRPTTA